MGNKSNIYGSATAQEILHDVPAGRFSPSNPTNPRPGQTLLVNEYPDPSTGYFVEYAGHKKYAASWDHYSVQAIDSTHLNYTLTSRTYLGEFDTQAEMEAAVNSALGYVYTRYFSEYFFDAIDKIYASSYNYVNVWKTTTNTNSNGLSATKPTYVDLISGYYLDTRSLPPIGAITPLKSQTLKLGYYRANPYEGVPGLRSIDWLSYEVPLIKDVPITLPITDPVLGTLWVDDSEVESLIKSLPNGSTQYAASDYFPSAVAGLFGYWNSLYATEDSKSLPAGTGSLISASESNQTATTVRILGANNNIWNNGDPVADVGFSANHPMFATDDNRAYNWHVKPVAEGIGTLLMDSPRTIEIHKALQAQNYQTEDLTATPTLHYLDWYIKNSSPAIPKAIEDMIKSIWNALGGEFYAYKADGTKRVSNLGWLIQNTAKILGIRRDEDGNINEETEKTKNRRIIDSSTTVDSSKVGVNSFGDNGMIIRRINNRFSGNNIVADQCVIVNDLLQLISEYQEQVNLSLGLQESSAIAINSENGVSRYPNQLAVMTELLNLANANHDLIRSTMVSSLVTQGQTSELIAGLGLPSITKTLPLKIDGSVSHLPYKGIAAHRSISQEVATATANIGIVLGHVI